MALCAFSVLQYTIKSHITREKLPSSFDSIILASVGLHCLTLGKNCRITTVIQRNRFFIWVSQHQSSLRINVSVHD